MGRRLLIKPGDRFGRLTIISEVEKRSKKRYFLCKCDCGNTRIERLVALRAGEIKSCGCERNERNRTANLKHGLWNSSLYSSWHCMKQRCFNKNARAYPYYGGRGITVCKEWLEFETFYKWALNNGYQQGLTIERNNVNGNYEPKNCSWIPLSEQNNNTRRSVIITFNGQTKNLKQWSEFLGIDYKLLRNRIHMGWSTEKAFMTPVLHRGKAS